MMRSPLRPRPAAIITVLLLLAGCRQPAAAPAAVAPAPATPEVPIGVRWTAVQTSVLTLVGENRYTAADALLQQFVKENARTAEGDRARWWRALIRTDQRAAAGEASVAFTQMDSLLGDGIAPEVRGEVMLVRRSLAALDSLRRLEIRRRTQAAQLAADRQDELKAARDSMSRLTAEIDRLRRRLSAP